MNTMKHEYCFQIHKTHNNLSKSLKIIQRLFLVICTYIIFGLLLEHVDANTDINYSNLQKGSANPYQTQHGAVWLKPDNGQNNTGTTAYIEALQVQTDVNFVITGAIARATVKQKFMNNSGYRAEGLYIFPLPENAAVDRFKMLIGKRIIEGKIKERVQAKKMYQKAKATGLKTSLIEQQRANVFTTSLANITAGEEISIEFEYQQVVDYKDGQYRLRYPMVVGPRYQTSMNINNNNETYRAKLKNLLNPDPNETSVYSETDTSKDTHNPTHIHILLDAGSSLVELNSSYHPVNIQQLSESRFSISTKGESIIANRDFELVWQPELDNSPQLFAYQEKHDGNQYAMLSLLPPNLSYLQQKVQARDIIFVIDISGSMAGTSIEQAKSSLITAIDSLSSIDRFNIIWFNNKAGRVFPNAVAAAEKYKKFARRRINSLQASGGTEMLTAIKLALPEQQEFSRFKQIVFLTDGNISNETELFKVIHQRLANNRLFTIGIGSAPNAYFMRKAASLGRGTFTYIGDINEVKQKTLRLFKKLETPALINIELNIDRNKYEIFPNVIADLYAGETATFFIKGKNLPENIGIKGDYGNSEWRTDVSINSTEKSGIHIAWARQKIDSLMTLQHEASNENERKTIKQEITNTALNYHLVSRYTSLIAVDTTPVDINDLLLRQRLKNNLPHGWTKPGQTTGLMLAQTAADTGFHLLLSFILFITAIFIRQHFHRRMN